MAWLGSLWTRFFSHGRGALKEVYGLWGHYLALQLDMDTRPTLLRGYRWGGLGGGKGMGMGMGDTRSSL